MTPSAAVAVSPALPVHIAGIAGLIAIFIFGTARPVNPGTLAIVMTFVVGTFAGEAPREMYGGFPVDLFVLLTGLGGAADFTPARYAHFTARRVSRGNLVLIGDASHMTSPQLGQGANHGLIDAVVLSDALLASKSTEVALRLFTEHRKRHVGFYQFASALMTPFFQSDSQLLAMVRDLTFHRMKILPYLQREMVLTLAGLKTGMFSSASPDEIVNCLADG